MRYIRNGSLVARVLGDYESCELYNWRTRSWEPSERTLDEILFTGDWTDDITEAEALQFIDERIRATA